MNKFWPIAGILGALMLISLLVIQSLNAGIPPLKCKAFSRATIDTENGALIFSLVENLQLYNKVEGMLEYEGYVKSPDSNTYLERTIYLSQGEQVDTETYTFKISKITSSPLNRTTDETFQQMWLENTSDNQSITLNLKKVKGNMLIVSSTYSPQYTCVKY